MYGVMCVHMYLPSPGAKTQSHIIVRDGFESDESTSRGDAGCVLRLSGLGREYVLRTRGGTCAGGGVVSRQQPVGGVFMSEMARDGHGGPRLCSLVQSIAYRPSSQLLARSCWRVGPWEFWLFFPTGHGQ